MRAVGAALTLGLLLAVGGSLAGRAEAQRPADAKVFLEELTSTEVRDAIRAGTAIALVPTGGTEQNGPHMALGKHNAVMRWAAAEIARRLGHALVAPVLAYVPEGAIDPPTGHMRYPGTLTLPAAEFQRVVEYAARSLRAAGFREVVLLGDSGDNQAPLRAAAARLAREWAGTGARAHFASDYYTAGADPAGPFASWLRAQGERPPAIGTHAGLADTSMLLAVDPRLVRADRLATAGAEPGVTGDPARASAEYGRRGLELRVEAAVAQIRRLIASAAGPGGGANAPGTPRGHEPRRETQPRGR